MPNLAALSSLPTLSQLGEGPLSSVPAKRRGILSVGFAKEAEGGVGVGWGRVFLSEDASGVVGVGVVFAEEVGEGVGGGVGA